ncbi:hypothetical protein ACIGXM_21705 [Kitasatospora sp. NPDC052896]|uniref:hypothetical protein n=1 Tax=Kitasatospora sp. NPDC052896 TaxID=3364061 RepID=UPI0037CA9C20
MTLTGLSKDRSGGVNAAVVTVMNRTNATASYAVKVEFLDPSGHSVDSTVVGSRDVGPGASGSAIAYTPKDPDAALVAKVVQAQRY